MKELAYIAGYRKEWLKIAKPNSLNILGVKSLIAIYLHKTHYNLGKIDAINDFTLD